MPKQIFNLTLTEKAFCLAKAKSSNDMSSFITEAINALDLLPRLEAELEQCKADLEDCRERLLESANSKVDAIERILLALPQANSLKSQANNSQSQEIKLLKPTPAGLRAYLESRREEGHEVPWCESFDSYMPDRLIKFFTTSTQQYFKPGRTDNAIADYNHWNKLDCREVQLLADNVLGYFEQCDIDTNGFKHRLNQWLKHAKQLETIAEGTAKREADQRAKLEAEALAIMVIKEQEAMETRQTPLREGLMALRARREEACTLAVRPKLTEQQLKISRAQTIAEDAKIARTKAMTQAELINSLPEADAEAYLIGKAEAPAISAGLKEDFDRFELEASPEYQKKQAKQHYDKMIKESMEQGNSFEEAKSWADVAFEGEL